MRIRQANARQKFDLGHLPGPGNQHRRSYRSIGFIGAAILAAGFSLTIDSAKPQTRGASQKPDSVDAARIENGRRLFLKDGCYECHGRAAQGGSAGPRIGPEPVPISAFIAYARQPTGQMPPYTDKVISDQELSDIHQFLASMAASSLSKASSLFEKK
jgi:mono/diheme cytochrome c family protein